MKLTGKEKLAIKKDIFINLTENNLQREVLECEQPVLVKVGAEWLGTCDIMAPILEELYAEYNGQIKFGAIDSDESNRLAGEYGVAKLPTFIFFRRGKMVDQIIGAAPKSQFVKILSKLL